MHTLRTLSGSPYSMFYPPFRKVTIDVADDSPQYTVLYHLRRAWFAIPPPVPPTLPASASASSPLWPWIKANSELSPASRLALPQNPDLHSLDTPWRSEVYKLWGHVFWDVAGFLKEVGPEGLWFEPGEGKCGRMGLEWGKKEGVKMMWETPVFVTPAFLGEGVRVRATVVKEKDEEEGEAARVEGEDAAAEEETEIGTFDDIDVAEVWYFRKGTEGRYDSDSDGGSEDEVEGEGEGEGDDAAE